MKRLDVAEFLSLQQQGLVVVDARQPAVFAEGFIPESVSIPYNEDFLDFVGELLTGEQQVLIVADDNIAAEVVKKVHSSGITGSAGYLGGGIEAWKEAGHEIDMLITIEADEFAMDYQFDEFFLVDIRSKEEFEKEHVEDAENIALIDIEPVLVEMESQGSYYVYGNTAAAAVTAASLFKRNGFERVRPIASAYEAIKATNVPFFVQKKKGQAPPPKAS